MATRKQFRNQSEALKEHLREQCRNKTLRAGDAVPPLRQLSEEFGLSQGSVVKALRELCEEGLLHTVERVGTFVGPQRQTTRPLFVFVCGQPVTSESDAIRDGFEERVAALGGSVVMLGDKLAREMVAQGRFPVCAGVFELAPCLDEAPDARLALADDSTATTFDASRVARVRFADGFQDRTHDCVSFDDHAGGELAAEYLLAMGHRRLAFVGLHGADDVFKLRNGQAVRPEWSARREEGWASAMTRARAEVSGLSFHAHSRLDEEHDHFTLADESTRAFLKAFKARIGTTEQITAAVVANDETARLLSSRLAAVPIERELWPALVSFDGGTLENDVLTSLRLPWSKVGREAANLLWERSQGVLTGEPVHRRVAPILIPRLSCRADPNARTLAA